MQILKIIVFAILDRHHVWRSLDPTLAIWTNFVRERIHFPPFFHVFLKRRKFLLFASFCCSHLFSFFHRDITSFYSHLPRYLLGYLPGYLHSYPAGNLHAYLMLPNLI